MTQHPIEPWSDGMGTSVGSLVINIVCVREALVKKACLPGFYVVYFETALMKNIVHPFPFTCPWE